MTRRVSLMVAIGAGALALAGCATPPADPAARAAFEAQHDPLEPMNRKIFAFNQAADRAVIKPVAQAYVRALPQPVRNAIRDFLHNLTEPVVVLNNVLQAQFRRAAISGARFTVNSVAGPLGFRDVAAHNRLPAQSGDFGQTLFAWGVRDGPYLVVPLFGPTSLRDGVGRGGDVYLDPFRYVAREHNWPTMLTSSRTIVGGIDQRSRALDALDALQRTSIDFYAALRSYYRQNRAVELRHGAAPPAPADLYEDPDASPPK